MSYRYYEGQLPPAEREVFRAMQRGLSSYERQFSVPRLDIRRLGEVFSMVKLDCPMIFHVEKLMFSFADSSSNVTVKPIYSMKKQEYESTFEIVKKRLKKILAPSEGFGFFEKEKFVHDYIVKNVRYDRLTKAYSHEVTGPLCHGIGVCEGMSKTFKLMCDELGIDTIVVTGIGVPPDAATGKKSERHAWNIVLYNGHAFGVDVTFDASLTGGGKIRYNYFNIPDEKMARDHGNVDFPVPRCLPHNMSKEV